LYSSYLGKDLVDTQGDFVEKDVAVHRSEVRSAGRVNTALVGSNLRVFRLALVTDPGYSNYWGGPGNVSAAKVQLMNRVNMAYEDDFAYRIDLVANNDLL